MNIYWQLIWAYIKIGIFGFGGGYAMLTLVRQAVVEPGWISDNMFTDIVAISQMTPGPIGINSATYIGFVAPASVNPELSGIWWALLGSCLATIAVVTPPYILTLYSSQFIRCHKDRLATCRCGANRLSRYLADECREFLSRPVTITATHQHCNMRCSILSCLL